MDCIKYRRMLPTYLAGILYLKKNDPAVWKFSQEGNSEKNKRTPYPLHQLVGIMQANKKIKIWKLKEGWKEYLVTLTQERDSF